MIRIQPGRVLSCVATILLFASAEGRAVVRYVKWDAAGLNNGTSWTDAHIDLQSALAAAVSGDEIWVAAGTYKPAGPGGVRTATFQLKNSVGVYGGFIGTELNRTERNSNPLTNGTALSGDLNGNDQPDWINNGENVYHVVSGSLVDSAACIDGFLITGGNANSGSNTSGGGMYLDQCNLTVAGCVLFANRANNIGGGIYAANGNTVFSDCSFRGNYSASAGGGLYLLANISGCPVLLSCEFSGNSSGGSSGGLAVGASISITNCTFSRNHAATLGGGVYGGSAGPVMTNCILWENSDSTGMTSSAQYKNGSGGPTLNYSCIQGGWIYNGGNNITTDPLFVNALGPDGVAGTLDDDLRLSPTSSAIDAGNSTVDTNRGVSGNQSLPSRDTLDQRRFVDTPSTPNTGVPLSGTSDVVDMGPYEYNGIVIQGDPLKIAEGGTASFTVALERQPAETAQVTVSFQSGDPDIIIQSGSVLTFTPADYNIPQTVVLAATEDTDLCNGITYFVISSLNLPLLTARADEVENDVQGYIYVDGSALPGGIGNSWSSPFNRLQDALAVAASANGSIQEIWVRQGTYKPDSPGGDRTKSFALVSGIGVYGGFDGTEIARNQRDTAAHPTILSGDLNGNDAVGFANRSDNSYHVIQAANLANLAILDGFTVRGGDAMVAGHTQGAGLKASSSKFIARNCLFQDNRTIGYGGGAYAYSGSPLFADCTFEGNASTTEDGGGAYVSNMSGTAFVNCRFLKNSAPDGGGVYATNSVSRLVNCVFSGNVAVNNGAAVHVYSHTQGTLYLDNCTVTGNRCTNGSAAVFLTNNASLIMNNSILWGNSDIHGTVDTSQLTSTSGGMSLYYSCIQGWTGSLQYAGTKVGIIAEAPFFVDADGVDNIVGTADDDLRLMDGSPCIDSGKNSAVPADAADLDGDGNVSEQTPLDLAHAPRFVDDQSVPDTGTGSAPLVDMGAYELGMDAALFVSGHPVSVPEGGPATIDVSLLADPGGTMNVTVVWVSGDPDLTVQSGSNLVFDSTNYSTPQHVEIAAAEDIDFIHSKAYFQISAPGKVPFVLRATEIDNDTSQPLLVKAGATGGNSGMSWQDAYTSLQSALDAAAASGGLVKEIWVAVGTYKPSKENIPGDPRSATFTMLGGIAIYGGFSGNEGSRDQRNPNVNISILSGDIGVTGTATDNCCHIVTAGLGLSADTVLDGFTISDGYANSATAGSSGGGMMIVDGSPTLRNCIFTNNRATYLGGGLYMNKESLAISQTNTPKLINCKFFTNSAGQNGGGLYVGASRPVVVSCDFMGNTAINGGGACFAGCASCSPSIPYPRLHGCVFIGNNATNKGGALFNIDSSVIYMINCTASGNTAVTTGGVYNENGGSASLRQSILYGNFDNNGCGSTSQYYDYAGSDAYYCDIQGGWTDANSTNIDTDPHLTPDGHLKAGSPCIDAGDPAFVVDPNATTDPDGDSRILDGDGDTVIRVDIGADEWIDTDSDALPDWWETRYPTAAQPSVDTDGDGYFNIDEYQILAGNPVAVPIYVNTGNSGDPAQDGSLAHPYDTIQKGLSCAKSGDTVLVAAGTYTGSGNKDLNFAGKSVCLRAPDGPTQTHIDCQGSGRALNIATIGGPLAVLDGFEMINGQTDYGAGIRANGSRLALRNCRFSDNAVSQKGGGLYYDRTYCPVEQTTIAADGQPEDDAGVFANSTIDLLGTLSLSSGFLSTKNTMFKGSGCFTIAPGATLKVTGDTPNAAPTILYGTLQAEGAVVIDPSQQLVIAGNGIVDLAHTGTMTVNGKLIAQDSATVRNSVILVKQASITTAEPVQYNDIHMVNSLDAGGEFYVKDQASVLDNTITSEGDRYLDMDPDPAAGHPTINRNALNVVIETNPAQNRGTLLELRARDYECEAGGANPGHLSGAYQCGVAGRFTEDPAQNWVLDSLEIKAGAKLNLTNRPGFVFRTDTQYPETVYVKHLILRGNAILNTGLQTLYYENITQETGSQIVDEPLLGFSLGIIAMDDLTASPFNEFDIRIRQRLAGSTDPLNCSGSITRLPDARGTGDGVMEMKTQATGMEPASSVAAKGSFARAGDESITITFEYLFKDNPNAEIVVKLSDKQEVGERSYEVARVKMPASGNSGSIGSDEFAVFYAKFPRVRPGVYDLNFTRGTYVELELRGDRDAQGNTIPPVASRIWIDNYDPQVTCQSCADLNGSGGTTEEDFLLLMSELGLKLPASDADHQCLDIVLSSDKYVDLYDFLAWDMIFADPVNTPPNLCRGTIWTDSGFASTPMADPIATAYLESAWPAGLWIAGKKTISMNQADCRDYLFRLDSSGTEQSNEGKMPAGGEQMPRGNGPLVRDYAGVVHQIHGRIGLVNLETHQTVIAPQEWEDVNWTVAIGATSSGLGMPLRDVVFGPDEVFAPDETPYPIAYVVPVVVKPASGDTRPYMAAAKLKLLGGGSVEVMCLYGQNPWQQSSIKYPDDPTIEWNSVVFEPDHQRLREVELDSFGNLFVLSAQGVTDKQNWVLVYNTAVTSAEPIAEIELGEVVDGPAIMTLATSGESLYLASTVEDAPYVMTDSQPSAKPTTLYQFTVERNGSNLVTGLHKNGDNYEVQTVEIRHPINGDTTYGHTASITAIQQDPGNGALYIVGYSRPRLSPTTDSNDVPGLWDSGTLYFTPTFAAVPDNQTTFVNASRIDCDDMTLPLSMVFVGGSSPCNTPKMDANGDLHVDAADFDAFSACYNGPTNKVSGDCLCVDANGDQFVDAVDFDTFSGCYNGPTNPPRCAE